ncbi:MAG: translation elongation factor Ts [Nitrospinota bacterium]
MSIGANLVKELRGRSGAGIMDCKKALKESNGDIDAAADFLRKKGISGAEKKMGRTTSEGLISSYIHQGGKIGVLLEINCETDFVARTDQFQDLSRDISMHIAAAMPQYTRREEVPVEVVEKEKEIFSCQARESKKPENVIQKIVAGKIEKFYAEVCLVEQKYVKDPDITIEGLIRNKISELGENISIKRFTRYVLGE